MVNMSISNLCVIVVTLAVTGWCLLPISNANTSALRQRNEPKSVYDKILEAVKKEFTIDNSSNIFRNSLSRDKNVKLLSFTPTHGTAPAEFKVPRGQLPQLLLEEHEMPVNGIAFKPVLGENVKIHNDVLYEIDKSNQGNNSNDENNNKLNPTFSLSNIKLANSSTLAPSSSSEAMLTASSFSERAEMHDPLTHTKSEQHLLHRHKRYLLFPAGSSFQLVFDLIIPIVDYTNFAIMGITCAVAWELPSKPPSEIIENFRTKLNDGTQGLNRRNDSIPPPVFAYVNSHRKEFDAVRKQHLLPQFLAIEPKPPLPQPLGSFYYNSKNIQHGHPPPQHFHGYNYDAFKRYDNGKYSYKNTSKQLPIYRNSATSPTSNKQANLYYSHTADNWWDRSKYRLKKNWQKQKWQKQPKDPQPFYQPAATFSRRTSRNRKILIKPPKHRIYPIFGKRRRRRSAGNRDDNFTKKLQAIHNREHFQTRQKLYRIIEKVYKTRGQNGTACVLRALCETTRRMHLTCYYNETPQSFVVELLRSIFALPKEIVAKTKESPLHVDARYVDAILIGHDVTQSCSEKYYDCKYNILFG